MAAQRIFGNTLKNPIGNTEFKDHKITMMGSLLNIIGGISELFVNKRTRTPTFSGWILIVVLTFLLLNVFWRKNLSEEKPRPDLARFLPKNMGPHLPQPNAPDEPQMDEFKAINDKNLAGNNPLVIPDFDPNKHFNLDHKRKDEQMLEKHGKPEPHKFPVDLLLEPKLHCNEGQVLLLLMVQTTPYATGERSAIRRSWGIHDPKTYKRLPGKQWVTLFVTGQAESRFDGILAKENAEHNDVLQGAFKDTPLESTRKFMMGMKWITENAWQCKPQFILKTEDNIFHNMHAILPWLTTKFADGKGVYTGKLLRRDKPIRDPDDAHYVPVHKFGEDTFPDLIQGPVYLFSEDAFTAMAKMRAGVPAIVVEDAYVGILASRAKITPKNNDHFLMLHRPNNMCHHLKMFFIFNIMPHEHMEILRKMQTALTHPECLNANTVDKNKMKREKILM